MQAACVVLPKATRPTTGVTVAGGSVDGDVADGVITVHLGWSASAARISGVNRLLIMVHLCLFLPLPAFSFI
jgi:hypothetical protein